MAGVLKVVCTPIGNLGDMSPRAIDALSTSAVILSEDTRHSRQLFSALQIGLQGKKLLSCDQHNELERLELVIERLREGEDVALVSDAGAPAVSDPGSRLVDGVAQQGFRVEVMPGASAVTAALMGAGLDATRYAFLGFLPKKGRERERLVKDSIGVGLALVIYEAPQRVSDTLSNLFAWCGARRVVVARELTKRFETFHRGVLGGALEPPFVELGEVVIVVEAGAPHQNRENKISIEERAQQLLADAALHGKEAAKILAQEFDIKSQEAYRMLTSMRAR